MSKDKDSYKDRSDVRIFYDMLRKGKPVKFMKFDEFRELVEEYLGIWD